LSQSGTSAPTVVILENTLGVTPTWTYESAGSYKLSNSDNTFPSGKTLCLLSGNAINTFSNPVVNCSLNSAGAVNDTLVYLACKDTSANGVNNWGGLSISIEVYP